MPERFWSKVNRLGDDNCWIWQAHLNEDGYGQFRHNGRMEQAHRVAYELTYGRFPRKLRILHTCDNPPCCNPSHLFKGTQNDNVQDMIKKGRQVNLKGEQHGNAKLTSKQVIKIRSLAADGISQSKLSRLFRVSEALVNFIVNRKSWRHI